MDRPPPPDTGRLRHDRWREAVVLASVLALAAVLRFGGLGWGLRHQPHIDERYFVENVGWMLAHARPRPSIRRVPRASSSTCWRRCWPGSVRRGSVPTRTSPRARWSRCSAWRAWVSCTCSACACAGPATGLAAALILAVSPVEVQTAHMVRPDVVLEAFVLIAFLGIDAGGDTVARRHGGGRLDGRGHGREVHRAACWCPRTWHGGSRFRAAQVGGAGGGRRRDARVRRLLAAHDPGSRRWARRRWQRRSATTTACGLAASRASREWPDVRARAA